MTYSLNEEAKAFSYTREDLFECLTKIVAQEVLYAYMDVEKDLSQPKILIHTLEELRKLISYSNENVDFNDELNVMYASGWGDALKQIDAVCDELENL